MVCCKLYTCDNIKFCATSRFCRQVITEYIRNQMMKYKKLMHLANNN